MKKKVKPGKIVLLDFYSEKNRGDAAIQAGLIDAVKRHFPGAALTACASARITRDYGAGEHFFQTKKQNVEITGGLTPIRPRYDRGLLRFRIFRYIHVFYSAAYSILLLVFLNLRPPARLLYSLLPPDIGRTVREIADSDLVIWRGTNFRIKNSGFRRAFYAFTWTYHPLACLCLKKPVACVGISLWPVTNFFAGGIFRFVFKKCFFVAAREEESFARLKKIIGGDDPRLHLVPDMSIVYLKRLTGFKPKRPAAGAGARKTGITVADKFGVDGAGREKYAELIKKLGALLLSGRGAEVVIIPQVTNPWENARNLESRISRELNENFPGRLKILPGEPDVEGLIAIYKNLDLLLATRLHSSIFALSAGVPAFVLKYDEGPQWHILRMLGAGEYVFDYNRIEARDILPEFKRFLSSAERYPAGAVLKNFSRCYEEISAKFLVIKESYESILGGEKLKR